MAQSLRQIKSRIRGVESTRKLTRAMEMVSSSKLKRTQKMRDAATRYYLNGRRLLTSIVASGGQFNNPLLEVREGPRKLGLVVVTSDTGLCGAYNILVLRAAEQFIADHSPASVTVCAVGKKGFSYFKRKGFDVPHSFLGSNGRYSDELCRKLLDTVTGLFISGEVNEWYAVYAKSEGSVKPKPVAEKFLPLDCSGVKPTDYILESGIESILAGLLPLYMEGKMRMVLLESFSAEHQARALAMGEATKNAVELMEKLVLTRNKMRQANITKEILEIISSAEALKG